MQNVDPTGTGGQAALNLAKAAFTLLEPVAMARPFLESWPKATVPRITPPESLPVLRWLEGAVALCGSNTVPLTAMLAETAAHLAWRQSYAATDFGPAFLDRYGWSELVGPGGPLACDGMACGFLILGPDVHYPSHAHEAEELYVPLAGTALWQRGETEPLEVLPGTPIHHPSWLPHAMMTGAEPLVALYCWRGGPLGAKPRILDHS